LLIGFPHYYVQPIFCLYYSLFQHKYNLSHNFLLHIRKTNHQFLRLPVLPAGKQVRHRRKGCKFNDSGNTKRRFAE
jgi:hypothetical protein